MAASGIVMPMVTFLEDGCSSKCCFKGFLADIWYDLSIEMNFTYTIKKETSWGSLDNGSWTGMIGMLSKGKLDIAPADFTITKARSTVVDFLPTITEGYHQMYLKNPLDSLHWSAYTEPLSYHCWLAGLMFVGILFVILYQRNKVFSNRVALTSVFFGGALIFWHWEAMLISFLAVRKIVLPIRTLQDLSLRSDYAFMVQKNMIYEDLFRYATDPVSLKIWKEKMEQNIDQYPSNEKEMVQILLRRSNLVIYGGQSIKKYREYLTCDILDTGVSFYQEQLAFAIRKNSPYFEAFSFHINRLKESGDIGRYDGIYGRQKQVCPDYSGKPISIKQCFTSFISIIIGFGVSLLWLVLELCLPRKLSERFNKLADMIFEQLNVNLSNDVRTRRNSI
jgi:ABC-type amino acid transport substrate-binding protein